MAGSCRPGWHYPGWRRASGCGAYACEIPPAASPINGLLRSLLTDLLTVNRSTAGDPPRITLETALAGRRRRAPPSGSPAMRRDTAVTLSLRLIPRPDETACRPRRKYLPLPIRPFLTGLLNPAAAGRQLHHARTRPPDGRSPAGGTPGCLQWYFLLGIKGDSAGQ